MLTPAQCRAARGLIDWSNWRQAITRRDGLRLTSSDELWKPAASSSLMKMVEDPEFVFGSHSAPFGRNESIAKRPNINWFSRERFD